MAGAGAGAEIMDKGGAQKGPEPKINNFGSASLEYWVHTVSFLFLELLKF